eukprot:SAG31_NODE_3105_length_4668_cov_1.437733_7_plen_178_part_00
MQLRARRGRDDSSTDAAKRLRVGARCNRGRGVGLEWLEHHRSICSSLVQAHAQSPEPQPQPAPLPRRPLSSRPSGTPRCHAACLSVRQLGTAAAAAPLSSSSSSEELLSRGLLESSSCGAQRRFRSAIDFPPASAAAAIASRSYLRRLYPDILNLVSMEDPTETEKFDIRGRSTCVV